MVRSGLILAGTSALAIAGAGGWFLWRDAAPPPVNGQPQARPSAPAEMAATEALSEPAAAEAVAEPAPPEAQPPGFDVVRVTDDGAALIAGQAAPGEMVALYLDDAQIAESLADGQGQFVIMLRLEPSSAPQMLSLAAIAADGTRLEGRDVVVLAPRVVLAEARPMPEAVPESVQPRVGPDASGAPAAAEGHLAEATPDAEAVADAGITLAQADAETEPDPEPRAAPGAGAMQADAPPAETILPEVDHAVEAPPAMQTAAAPQVQADFLFDAEGRVRVLDPAPDLAGNVTIEAISYGLEGTVLVSGRASRPGRSPITLYLDNRPQALTWAEDGVWSLALQDVAPGLYRLRADELDPDGRVVSRFETPFLREDPLAVARLLGRAAPAPAPAEPSAAPEPLPAADDVAAEQPQPVVEPPASRAGPEAATRSEAAGMVDAQTGQRAGADGPVSVTAPVDDPPDIAAAPAEGSVAVLADAGTHAVPGPEARPQPQGAEAGASTGRASPPPEDRTPPADQAGRNGDGEAAATAMAEGEEAEAAMPAMPSGLGLGQGPDAVPEPVVEMAVGPTLTAPPEPVPLPEAAAERAPEALAEQAAAPVPDPEPIRAARAALSAERPEARISEAPLPAEATAEPMPEPPVPEALATAAPAPASGHGTGGDAETSPRPAPEPSSEPVSQPRLASLPDRASGPSREATPEPASTAALASAPASSSEDDLPLPVPTAPPSAAIVPPVQQGFEPAAQTEPEIEPETARPGSIAPASMADAAPEMASAGVQLITVQPGHTLWGISHRHYGDGALYVQIFRANRDQIRDPHWIYPGQIFALPD